MDGRRQSELLFLNAIHRCPSCKKFSHSDGSAEAACEHCGAYLDPIEVSSRRKYEEEKRKAELKHEHPVFWVNVKPGDNVLKSSFVRMIQGAQIAYMAIISFILWIVAVIAG
jgi:hypothetical protein